jgi:multiple sugar transport system substrate-binding protein
MPAFTTAPSPPSSGWDRRGLLRAGGAGLGAAALGRRARAQEVREITFAFAPDPSGSMAALFEAFNEAYEGRYRVAWREMPVETDAFRDALIADFRSDQPEIDVFGADVIWTAPFASERWVLDLSREFYRSFAPEAFLDASLNSTFYRNRIWAVPWFAAAGMLYYRRDLLEASGFTSPPETWDELAEQALKVREDAGVAEGYVFQGAAYEGGVTNALEYIWSAGGRVMTLNPDVSQPGGFVGRPAEPNVVTVASPAAARGLDIARDLIERGVAPEAVASYNEQESLTRFLAGEAVFMRNWPFVHALLGEGEAQVGPEQVGIAAIPAAAPGGRHFSCLGGWNLMISRRTRAPDAAWNFVRFATSPESQKRRAIQGGFMPTRRALYTAEEVREAVPVVAKAAEIFADTRTRPVTPVYPEISEQIAATFNRVLRGEVDGREAVASLQTELRRIVHAYR